MASSTSMANGDRGRSPTNNLFYTFATMRAWIDRGAQHSPLSRGARVWRDGDEGVTQGENTTAAAFKFHAREKRATVTGTRRSSPLGSSQAVCAPRRTFTNISNDSAESYQRAADRRDIYVPSALCESLHDYPTRNPPRGFRFADIPLPLLSLFLSFFLSSSTFKYSDR